MRQSQRRKFEQGIDRFPTTGEPVLCGTNLGQFGAYFQVTYDDQSGTIGIDNTDIRFADVATVDGHNVIYGMSLNNNPTVQDLWNSHARLGTTVSSTRPLSDRPAGARIEGAMAQAVAGLSAYTYIDHSDLRRSRGLSFRAAGRFGGATTVTRPNNVISGVAPYWRRAYEFDWGQNSGN